MTSQLGSRRTKASLLGVFILALFLSSVTALLAGDPSGGSTGTAADIPAKEAGKPTQQEIADTVGHNRVSINFSWILITGYLVMFMQAGFPLAETGFCRAKSAAHTMAMNFFVYAIGMLGFWICGYALMFGGVGGIAALGNGTSVLDKMVSLTLGGKTFDLFGFKGFFLSGSTYDVAVFSFFLFQMVFMDTAATIPTGAMAERWKLQSFVLASFVMSMLIYPIYGAWMWGGGWLADLGANFGLGHGAVDFAGSSVVHMVGGVAGLAGAINLGARIGKYKSDGTPVAMPGHNIPMALLGVFILAFGWFGFNPGSTFAGTDLRIGVIATNTMLASAAGAFSAMLLAWAKFGKPDPALAANGMLAGLVAITCPCAFVSSVGAVIIGLIAGMILVWAVTFIERTLKIDDPVGAIAVHGVNGAWGMIALGLLADGTYGDGWNAVEGTVRGLFYGGGASQLVAQIIAVCVCTIWVFVANTIALKIIGALCGGNRVSVEDELQGLDMPETGLLAYPDDVMTEIGSAPLS